MSEESQYFSEEGLAKLKQELESCKITVRREIADRLEYAKSLGDLSENSEYQEAKEAQMLNESKIAELEDMLRRAVLVRKSTPHGVVEIGSKVTIASENGQELTYFLVGANEAAPHENKISHESPLGNALLGRKKGEMINAQTPKGFIRYTIMEIN